MQILPRLELSKRYSIKGVPVTIIKRITLPDLLRGTAIYIFESETGKKYKATQWWDGTIYRIHEIKQ